MERIGQDDVYDVILGFAAAWLEDTEIYLLQLMRRFLFIREAWLDDVFFLELSNQRCFIRNAMEVLKSTGFVSTASVPAVVATPVREDDDQVPQVPQVHQVRGDVVVLFINPKAVISMLKGAVACLNETCEARLCSATERPYQCEQCGASFRESDVMSLIHPEDPSQMCCSVCSGNITSSSAEIEAVRRKNSAILDELGNLRATFASNGRSVLLLKALEAIDERSVQEVTADYINKRVTALATAQLDYY